ncbi:MAG: glycosyltransferase family 2 protein [Candidatus Dependentiae bacterium]|nr:glycosyltransferase family 2 protein [Candidatus Dependentiae bacterium]
MQLAADCKDFVTIAILAKDKAHVLPLFLACIERQTWPKNKTKIYIRTNNNNDNTAEILSQWLDRVAHLYAEVFFDATDVPQQVQHYKQHEWNSERFEVLGKIRELSIQWAYNNNSHYFVVDCDNFIKPHTLERLMSLQLSIVAPFLTTGQNYYSNYHAAIDGNGYLATTPFYEMIFNRQITGLIQVPVVHCTYLIRRQYLPYVWYRDNSGRYEYVIFSDVARKNGIPQYIDNREMYGYVSFAEDIKTFSTEPWLQDINSWFN